MVEKENNSKEKSSKKELFILTSTMVGLIIVFIIASGYFQGLNSFEYEGLTFKKDKFDQIEFYLYSYTSILTPSATRTNAVNLVLRIDPRENNVPVEGDIELPYGSPIYIGINSTGIVGCDYSTLSLASLSSFLASNGFNVIAGSVDEAEAEANELEVVSCEKYPDSAVLIVQSGEESKITRDGNCYTLIANSCEILPVVEKFAVQSIIDAKERVS